MKTCEELHKQCDCFCCKGFWVTITPDKSMHEYYKYHLDKTDFENYIKTGKIRIWVMCPCRKLDMKTYKCTIYETRPLFCRGYKCDFLIAKNI